MVSCDIDSIMDSLVADSALVLDPVGKLRQLGDAIKVYFVNDNSIALPISIAIAFLIISYCIKYTLLEKSEQGDKYWKLFEALAEFPIDLLIVIVPFIIIYLSTNEASFYFLLVLVILVIMFVCSYFRKQGINNFYEGNKGLSFWCGVGEWVSSVLTFIAILIFI